MADPGASSTNSSGVRLSVRTPYAMRARPRRGALRLDAAAVEALLAGSEP